MKMCLLSVVPNVVKFLDITKRGIHFSKFHFVYYNLGFDPISLPNA